jgi:recombination protein RecA
MKNKRIELDVDVSKDTLSSILQELNKDKSSGEILARTMNDFNDMSTVKEWISSGSKLLDLAAANRKPGGLPVGRLVVINGNESSGKSLLCGHIIAESQKKGYNVVYMDTENATDPQFMKAIGVNLEKVLLHHPLTVEDAFDDLYKTILAVKKSKTKDPTVIIIDSITATNTKKSTEQGVKNSVVGFNTEKAKYLNDSFSKLSLILGENNILLVLTSQLREKLNASFGDKYVMPGGGALKFYPSIIIRLKPIKTLDNKYNICIGKRIEATIYKNKCGPAGKKVAFEMYFDRGIRDIESWIYYLKVNNLISGTEAGYTYTNKSGETLKLKKRDFILKLTTSPEFKEEIYNLISEHIIMTYKVPDDDSEIVEGDVVDE